MTLVLSGFPGENRSVNSVEFSMEFYGVFHGIFFMKLRLMEFHEIPWNYVNSWNFMKFGLDRVPVSYTA
jgi:hypothetical protein